MPSRDKGDFDTVRKFLELAYKCPVNKHSTLLSLVDSSFYGETPIELDAFAEGIADLCKGDPNEQPH